jgi:hypothetical protein
MIPSIPTLSSEKCELLEHLVNQLASVAGMAAVVLGGSHASGTAHAGSDIDLGLYYEEANPFAVAEIRSIAEAASTESPATITDFYGWGAWVNGGAWIHSSQGKVDFLYRNLAQVSLTIDEAAQGITHHDYDQQPAFGFYSVIYLAETKICIPLFDPLGVIAKLKEHVAVYPPALKQKLVADSLWAAEFTLANARGFCGQGDIYNTVGCLTRASSNLTQALFALNETYFIRDKKVFDVIDQFPIRPDQYTQRVASVLAHPGSSMDELKHSVAALETVWQSVTVLPGVNYTAKFIL